eukprot:COSAG02_NODE_2363_length_9059_cov_7.474219_12_plen_97_part_00
MMSAIYLGEHIYKMKQDNRMNDAPSGSDRFTVYRTVLTIGASLTDAQVRPGARPCSSECVGDQATIRVRSIRAIFHYEHFCNAHPYQIYQVEVRLL